MYLSGVTHARNVEAETHLDRFPCLARKQWYQRYRPRAGQQEHRQDEYHVVGGIVAAYLAGFVNIAVTAAHGELTIVALV